MDQKQYGEEIEVEDGDKLHSSIRRYIESDHGAKGHSHRDQCDRIEQRWNEERRRAKEGKEIEVGGHKRKKGRNEEGKYRENRKDQIVEEVYQKKRGKKQLVLVYIAIEGESR